MYAGSALFTAGDSEAWLSDRLSSTDIRSLQLDATAHIAGLKVHEPVMQRCRISTMQCMHAPLVLGKMSFSTAEKAVTTPEAS